jgi:hypothetical protein
VIQRGVDEHLGRQVVIEEFAAGFLDQPEGAAHLAWLRAMARHPGPHLQRVLRIDRPAEGNAQRARLVCEAPVGAPFAPVAGMDRVAAARFAIAVCRALAGAHGEGVAHGDLARAVLVEEAGPTLLVAGYGPTGRSPTDDLADLVALLSRAVPAGALDDAPRTDVAALAAWAVATAKS